jgi:hypothetical protein
MKIIRTKRELEELSKELKAADEAAAAKPGSRDWKPCPSCSAPLVADRVFIVPQGVREMWECLRCACSVSFVADPPPAAGELTRFQWSKVRHSACILPFGGHLHCLPELWFKRLQVSADGLAVESPELGRLELRGVANPPRSGRV